ncbi:MAG: M48 family metallopeptidase [Prevotellaceae bacterium]|nr:M48 family metallopeptidase [Candidatus Minthosoma caballi]
MKHYKSIFLATAVAAILTACGTSSTVPVTGRKHRLLVDDASMLSLSTQQYKQYMTQAKVSTDKQNTQMVERVGRRLANAVETYLKNNGFANEIQNFKWEFSLVQNKEVNAFCMPGGKIVVYEGILPVTKDETSLAIVLGHEIAHAVAKHSAEQMSKQQRANTGLQIGAGLLSVISSDQAINSAATNAASTGLSLLNLKFSRDHESEADRIGLIFAAMAGYNPANAVAFWQRMAASSSSNTPVWMRTHPTDEKRISDIQNKFLPEAQKYYKAQ